MLRRPEIKHILGILMPAVPVPLLPFATVPLVPCA
jgi:hypothetical protein